MAADALYAAVRRFAAATNAFSEGVLSSNSWADEAYDGLRYAFLHTTLELRQLAARLLAQRGQEGRAPSVAQVALAEHHAAFRDFEALLIGLDAQDFVRRPGSAEWPANLIVAHVHDVERYFFGAILNTLLNQAPAPLDDAATAAVTGEALEIPTDAPLEQMWADYARLHARIVDALADLAGADLARPSPMWEPEPWPTIEFRLHRFAAHLREHTNQLEKVLALLDQRPNEARMLLRQMYAALAAVEGCRIGAPGFGEAACNELAARIDARLASVLAVLPRIEAMHAAMDVGDAAAVAALLAEDARLAYTVLDEGVSAILDAQYRGRRDLVELLLASGMRLSMAESAAVGEEARVRRIGEAWPQAVNEFSADGYSPLQLACYFGHPAIAVYLVEKGADIHAVARNPMRLQALHAAVASQQVELVRLLLEKGADVDARQQGDYTPLMAAQQNGNQAIVALLLAAGVQG